MNIGEQIFEALTDVGTDLVDMAEHQRFAKSPWRKAVSMAACLAMVVGMGAAAWQILPDLKHKTPTVSETPKVVEYSAEVENPEPEPPVLVEEERGWQPESLPFYVYDPDPYSRDDPVKAIAPDGRVLVEAESGELQPLIDELTGEYVAILVRHLPQTNSLEGAYLDVYDLEGNLITARLMAHDTRILGDIQLYNTYVDGEFTASLYDRRQEEWIPAVYAKAYIMGNVIVAEPVDDGMAWVYDHTGRGRQLPENMSSYLLDDGIFCVIVSDGNGCFGLEDAFGTPLTECIYTSIVSAGNGYAHCETEHDHFAVDLTTGEVVFQWDGDIYGVWENGFVVQGSESCLLLTRDGTVVAEANGIEVLDDDGDEIADLFFLSDWDTYTFLDKDGLTQDVFTVDGVVHAVSSRAAVVHTTEDFAILNWELGQTITEFDKDYFVARVYQDDGCSTGLFFAAHDTGIDLLREDGTVVLENLRNVEELQGDVTFCIEETTQGLKKLDGAWLYQEAK